MQQPDDFSKVTLSNTSETEERIKEKKAEEAAAREFEAEKNKEYKQAVEDGFKPKIGTCMKCGRHNRQLHPKLKDCMIVQTGLFGKPVGFIRDTKCVEIEERRKVRK